jgi:hypothetical protein
MSLPSDIQVMEDARTPEAAALEIETGEASNAVSPEAVAEFFREAFSEPESGTEPPVEQPGSAGEPGSEQPSDLPPAVAPEELPSTGPVVQSPVDPALISDAIKEGFQSIKQDLAPQSLPVTPEVEPPAPVPEPPVFPDSESFLEEFANNPVETVAKLAENIAQKKIDEYKRNTEQELAPMREAAQAQAKTAAVKNAMVGFFANPEFSDAGEMGDDIINTIRQNGMPPDDPISYERAYNKVKIGRLSQNKPLDAYLSDEESLSKLMSDPRVRDPLITKYLQEVASGTKPAVISQGNLPNATPPKTPQTLDEAGRMMVQSWA